MRLSELEALTGCLMGIPPALHVVRLAKTRRFGRLATNNALRNDFSGIPRALEGIAKFLTGFSAWRLGCGHLGFLSFNKMLLGMFLWRHKTKILDAVIAFVAVDVMNMMARRNRTVVSRPFDAMQQIPFSIERNRNVPLLCKRARPSLSGLTGRLRVAPGDLPAVVRGAKTGTIKRLVAPLYFTNALVGESRVLIMAPTQTERDGTLAAAVNGAKRKTGPEPLKIVPVAHSLRPGAGNATRMTAIHTTLYHERGAA